MDPFNRDFQRAAINEAKTEEITSLLDSLINTMPESRAILASSLPQLILIYDRFEIVLRRAKQEIEELRDELRNEDR